ncbi:MAG: hypothetical protein V2A67_11295 [Bacteroidota bacterium]
MRKRLRNGISYQFRWTPALLRSWDEYKTRLAKHGARFEAMGINYYRSPKVQWQL